MAIGATWNPEQSWAMGSIAGTELSAIGFNMLLGPSLDVLESPLPFSQGDLGTRSFGGDPYWVSVMGQAYTAGIHAGSEGRLAVIAKHFPGYGSSDRPINEEVGTVRKSLEQLKQIELAPFFAVTNLEADPDSIVDGLLTAHVRYQGFQGNIRSTTAPVSFDPQALSTLMTLPEFSAWRQNGGLIVSDELGVRAVERFYDATGQEFPHRQVAKDALLAGNDLLYLSSFSREGEGYQTHLSNIKDTITWFQEKYETDQTFQQRIDNAVTRILMLKLRLYEGQFDAGHILTPITLLPDDNSQSEAAVIELAQQAITLIAPGPAELVQQLPIAVDERVVFFTDVRQSQQCSSCPFFPWLDLTALEQRLLALYGPDASGQVQARQLTSFSYSQLKEYLLLGPEDAATATPLANGTESGDNPDSEQDNNISSTPIATPTLTPVEQVGLALQTADWLVFASLDQDPTVESSDALKLFLKERPDLAGNANVIVFAYNAPYYLDTTEISQLTAYFGIYSKIDAFINASVRTLFSESPLVGRSPVNIEGIRYDLFEATKPDSGQVIELYIVDEGVPTAPPEEAPLEVVPGAILRLQTGVVLDYNGHPVPDGTTVRFFQQDRLQGFVNVISEQLTVDGIANLDYLLDARSGNFRITASAGDAQASQEVDIVIGENSVVSVSTPTPAPTVPATPSETPTATQTPTATPSATPTLIPSPTPEPEPEPSPEEDPSESVIDEAQMLLGFGLGLIFAGGAGYAVGRTDYSELVSRVRCILFGIIGALVAYNYLALGLPGASWLEPLGGWAAFLITLFGGTVGILLYRIGRSTTKGA
jgi:beta-N-acetylhexosaminidase